MYHEPSPLFSTFVAYRTALWGAGSMARRCNLTNATKSIKNERFSAFPRGPPPSGSLAHLKRVLENFAKPSR